jgi:hypothetical protein
VQIKYRSNISSLSRSGATRDSRRIDGRHVQYTSAAATIAEAAVRKTKTKMKTRVAWADFATQSKVVVSATMDALAVAKAMLMERRECFAQPLPNDVPILASGLYQRL